MIAFFFYILILLKKKKKQKKKQQTSNFHLIIKLIIFAFLENEFLAEFFLIFFFKVCDILNKFY